MKTSQDISRFSPADSGKTQLVFPSPAEYRQTLELFNPNRRQAILVNSWDELQGASQAAIDQGISRGSRSLYELQVILGGKLFYPEHTDPMVIDFLAKEYEPDIQRFYRKSHSYEVFPIQASSGNQLEKLKSLTREMAISSDNQTLTFCYLRSHGNEGGVFIGRDFFRYTDLVAIFEKIPGKKVIASLACFSGCLVEEISKLQSKNFVAIASTSPETPSTNWGDDQIFDDLWSQIRKSAPISEWEIKPPTASLEKATGKPGLYLGFDVVL